MADFLMPENAHVTLFIEHCRHQLNSGKRTVPFPEGMTQEKLKESQEWEGFVGRLAMCNVIPKIDGVTFQNNTVTFEKAPT